MAINHSSQLDSDIGDHSRQMRRANHCTRDLCDNGVLQSHREAQERNRTKNLLALEDMPGKTECKQQKRFQYQG